MLRLFLLWVTCCGTAVAAGMTPQQAADMGKALGQQQDALTTPLVNSANVSSKIPGATANPTETQFFGGGSANNYTPGDSKRLACANGTPNPDPKLQAPCDAVNLVSQAPHQRPSVVVGRGDPMLQREQAARANASSIASSGVNQSNNPNGFGIAGNYSACTTTTTPDPLPPTIQTCNDFMQATSTTTSSTCQKSTGTPQTCNVVNSFTVTQGAPIAATAGVCPTAFVAGGVQRYVCTPTAKWSCPSFAPAYYPPGYPAYCLSRTLTAPAGAPYTWYMVTGRSISWILTSAPSGYTCPAGYTLSGTLCYPPPTATPTTNDGCSTLQAQTM